MKILRVLTEWAILYFLSMVALYNLPVFSPYYTSIIPGALFTFAVYVPIRYWTTTFKV